MKRVDFAWQFAAQAGYEPLSSAEIDKYLPDDLDGIPATHAGYIAALYKHGVLTGTSSTTFSPDQEMTRAQAAAMFARAYSLSGGPMSYTDVPSSYWAAKYIAAVTEGGLFKGIGNQLFDPNSPMQWEHTSKVFQTAQNLGYTAIGSGSTPVSSGSSTPSPPSFNDEGSAAITRSNEPKIPPPETDLDYTVGMIMKMFDLPDSERNSVTSWTLAALQGPEPWTFERTMLEFEGTEWFDRRFGTAIRTWEARGTNTAVPTVEEILRFEVEARRLLRRVGLPDNFYSSNEKLQEVLGAGVDLEELADRADLAYTRVQEAPLEVRMWYTKTYGVRGDDVLAAMLFDPDAWSEVQLRTMAESAAVGGAGQVHGFTLSEQLAGRLADIGVDFNRGISGFASIADMAPLFSETFGETNDLSALVEGVDQEFFGSSDELEDRRRSRLAAFSGGGEAATTQEGIIGLGSAE